MSFSSFSVRVTSVVLSTFEPGGRVVMVSVVTVFTPRGSETSSMR